MKNILLIILLIGTSLLSACNEEHELMQNAGASIEIAFQSVRLDVTSEKGVQSKDMYYDGDEVTADDLLDGTWKLTVLKDGAEFETAMLSSDNVTESKYVIPDPPLGTYNFYLTNYAYNSTDSVSALAELPYNELDVQGEINAKYFGYYENYEVTETSENYVELEARSYMPLLILNFDAIRFVENGPAYTFSSSTVQQGNTEGGWNEVSSTSAIPPADYVLYVSSNGYVYVILDFYYDGVRYIYRNYLDDEIGEQSVLSRPEPGKVYQVNYVLPDDVTPTKRKEKRSTNADSDTVNINVYPSIIAQ